MQTETINQKGFWDLIETPAANVVEVTNLIHWSMNYDTQKGTPYYIFLDLIGYSTENLGCRLFSGNPRDVLGFLEMDYLGDALKEYANNPQAVEDWIELLMEAETMEAEANK
jgi:hypothetical protein